MTAVLNSAPVTSARRSRSNLKFRFADVNPITGRAYRSSRFDDLPAMISVVVESHLGITARQWDAMVRSREVAEYVDCFQARIIPWTLDRAPSAPRVGDGPVDKCPDCWGTCVQIDSDGSISGVVGASTLCYCARKVRRAAR